MRKMTKNANFLKIYELGYTIECRSEQYNRNRIYLVKDGKRTGHYVSYWNNRQGPDGESNLLYAYRRSHKDDAMYNLLRFCEGYEG